ncbi:MAG: hypothetical protein WKF34_12410 [Pyrinomonadaceae bacterium]
MKVGRLTSELWASIASYFRRGSAGRTKGKLYSFDAPLLGYTRSVPAVIKGERKWIEQFIPLAEFQTLFGGYVTWHPTEEIDETIGVWGKRNVSRFRRLLRERGAEFDVIDNEGPAQRPWVAETHGYTKLGRRNLARTQKSQPKP